MQGEPRKRILDHIEKSTGYDIALMTTFNFEVGYFERAIINKLYDKNVKKISVFVDSKELTKAISEVEFTQAGLKYMVNPISMDSSFHPKVILLLGSDKAKLIVSSANLKSSGLEINNEVYNVVEYSSKHPEYLDVIVSAIEFFDLINKISYGLDNDIIVEAKRLPYYRKTKENGEIYFLHNLKKSIIDQLLEMITEAVNEIYIAVPYYDNALVALQRIKSAFNKAEIKLFIQNKKSTFPIEYNNKYKVTDNYCVFDGLLDGQSNTKNNFYHGKVMLFGTDKRDYVVYGSANCTNAALMKSYEEGGNVECDLLDIGEKGEFDYFFDNFEIVIPEKVQTNTLTFDNDEHKNFFFKYGIVKECVELHIGFINKTDVKVYFDDYEAFVTYGEEEIIVSLPEAITSTNLFNIDIDYDKGIETIRCWVLSYEALKQNRLKSSERIALENYDESIDSDKFKEDRYNLLMAETTCYQEFIEFKKLQSNYNQLKLEKEGEDSDIDNIEDFIVDVYIPEEYNVEYRKFDTVSKIRERYITRLLNGGFSFFNYSDHVRKEKTTLKKDITSNSSTPIIKSVSEEKRFASFVCRRIKGLYEKPLLEIIDAKHYYGIVLIILEIFSKYLETDIFDFDYIYNTRIELYTNTLRLSFKDEEGELEKEILKNAFLILLDNYVISTQNKDLVKREELDEKNRKLLLAIEEKYSIRSSYLLLLEIIKEKYSDITPAYNSDSFHRYIERLYGYKNYELLKEYIRGEYNNAEIEEQGSDLIIDAKVDNLKNHFVPRMNVLKEILDYSRHEHKIDTVKIKVHPKEESAINEIFLLVDFKFHKYYTKIYYKNGNVREEKPDYLNI